MSNTTFQKFCKTFEATVESTHEDTVRYSREDMFKPIGYNDEIMARRVPLVSIKMPEDRWRAFLDREAQLTRMFEQNSAINSHPVDYFWDEQVWESTVREEIPAVKIAYQKYQTLLELSRSYRG